VISAQRLFEPLIREASLVRHPQARQLLCIVTGKTATSSAGYPYLCQESFELFLAEVPHLFRDGLELLDWLEELERRLEDRDDLLSEEVDSLARACKVIRTMVFTAAVTAPPDLWLLRHVLAVHRDLGVLAELDRDRPEEGDRLAARLDLDPRQLRMDLPFLHSRGYLAADGEAFRLDPGEPGRVPGRLVLLPEAWRQDMVSEFRAWFAGGKSGSKQAAFLEEWLPVPDLPGTPGGWIAGAREIETGFRLLPLILALRACGLAGEAARGRALDIPRLLPGMTALLDEAGILRRGRVTALGERVFRRGPGPFGIIASYHPFLENLPELLRAGGTRPRVGRAANVAASQDANRRTFGAANDALDAFCRKYGFHYRVFLEHAVGRGEATRQRWKRENGNELLYFGADLEDAAIAAAEEEKRKGLLPANMEFFGGADIGRPEKVIAPLRARGVETRNAVMMVGNGFHEIRDQTNERMVAVFRAYREAGFLLIFTEESALTDEQLLQTGWNTYHAGFRYVHELSGQGLRPAEEGHQAGDHWSWRRCAREAGYVELEEFSHRTRTIFPYTRSRRGNPSISVTRFCIPRELAGRLGRKPPPGEAPRTEG